MSNLPHLSENKVYGDILFYDKDYKDFSIPESYVMQREYWFFASVLREKGEMEKAVKLLESNITIAYRIPLIEEIVATYIYFEEYEKALEYYKIHNFNTEKLTYLRIIAYMGLNKKQNKYKCGNDDYNELIHLFIQYFKYYFDRKMFKSMKNFTTNICKNDNCCFNKVNKYIISLFNNDFFEKTGYRNLKFIYYKICKDRKLLKYIIINFGNINSKLYEEFIKEANPTDDELIYILERRYSKELYMECIKREIKLDEKLEKKIQKIKRYNKIPKLSRKDKTIYNWNGFNVRDNKETISMPNISNISLLGKKNNNVFGRAEVIKRNF